MTTAHGSTTQQTAFGGVASVSGVVVGLLVLGLISPGAVAG